MFTIILTIRHKNMNKIWDTKVSQEMTSIQYSDKVLFVKIKYIINPYYFSINSWKYQIIPNFVHSRPIYIGKNQNPQNLGFLLYRLHCQKNP